MLSVVLVGGGGEENLLIMMGEEGELSVNFCVGTPRGYPHFYFNISVSVT